MELKIDKLFVLLFFLIIIISFSLGFIISKVNINGNLIFENNKFEFDYSWTKAICDDNNYCLDIEIYCKDGKVVDLIPISIVVGHYEGWNDIREENNFC